MLRSIWRRCSSIGAIDEVAGHARAGVVDEQVDRAVQVGEAGFDRVHVVIVGQVGDEDLDVGAVLADELGRQRLELLAATGDQHEIVPVTGEQPRERRPDPTRRTGDQRARRRAARRTRRLAHEPSQSW